MREPLTIHPDLIDIGARIKAAEDVLRDLVTERDQIRRRLEDQRLDALIAKLPPETLDALRQPRPRAQDMRRLVPRGLAFNGVHSRFWTGEAHSIRRRLGVSHV